MPCNYKRTSARQSWTDTNLKSALQAIADGASIKLAALTYAIPRQTLSRYHAHQEFGKMQLGRKVALGTNNEIDLVQHLLAMEEMGFGLTTTEVRTLVYEFCSMNNLLTPFDKENKTAGYDWLSGFMNRHPALSLRKPEKLSKQRALACNEFQVSRFFDILRNVYGKDNFDHHPQTIYNMDETGFSLVHDPPNVIALKGKKTVSAVTVAEKAELMTLLAACNATGEFLPPFVIMKGKRNMPGLDRDFPANTVLTLTETGWSNKEVFTSFLQHFINFCRRTPEGKVCLILDGHGSHADSLEALIFCREHLITLICLPPHTSHVLQPLDKAVFKTLKTEWSKAIHETLKIGKCPTRYDIGAIFQKMWLKGATMGNVIRGFHACGIFPLNPDVIQPQTFAPARLLRGPDQRQQHTANVSLEEEVGVIPFEAQANKGELRNERVNENRVLLEQIHAAGFATICPLPALKQSGRGRQRRRVRYASFGARELTSPENIRAQHERESGRTRSSKEAVSKKRCRKHQGST